MRTRIKEIRLGKGMSIRHISSKIGVSSSYISDVENGVIKTPSRERLTKIAEVLGVTFEDLLLDNEFPLINNRLREVRKELNLTQKELGDLVGISSNTIQRYELGLRVPNMHIMHKIAKSLGVNVSDIFDMDDEQDTNYTKAVIKNMVSNKIKDLCSTEEDLDLNKVIYNKGYLDALNFVLDLIVDDKDK